MITRSTFNSLLILNPACLWIWAILSSFTKFVIRSKLTVYPDSIAFAPRPIDRCFLPLWKAFNKGKSHHGDVIVHSEPRKGTSFHVYIPVLENGIPAAAPNREATDDIRGSGKKILFVDDETQICDIAKRVLSKHGFRVTVFSDSEEALRAYMDGPHEFDLVITDMTMPRLTGAELAKNILATRPEIPIILCTGQSDPVDREKALAIGISDYLAKPLLMRELLQAVGKALMS